MVTCGSAPAWALRPLQPPRAPGSSRRRGSDFSFQIQFLSNTSRFFSPSFNSVTQADSYTVYRSPATGLLCHISPVNLPVCQLSLSLSSRPDKYSFYWGIFHFSLSLSLCSSFPSLASSVSVWAALSCTWRGWPCTAQTSGTVWGAPRTPWALNPRSWSCWGQIEAERDRRRGGKSSTSRDGTEGRGASGRDGGGRNGQRKGRTDIHPAMEDAWRGRGGSGRRGVRTD